MAVQGFCIYGHGIQAGGYCAVCAGISGVATGEASAVFGKDCSCVGSARYSIVAGDSNEVHGEAAAVFGHDNFCDYGTLDANAALGDFIAGGGNAIYGKYAVALGYGNSIGDDENFKDYCVAIGTRNFILHDGAILIADGTNVDFESAAVNEFAVRATGGVRFVLAIDGGGNPTTTVSIDTDGNIDTGGDWVAGNYYVPDGGEVGVEDGVVWIFDDTDGVISTTAYLNIGVTDSAIMVHAVTDENHVASFDSSNATGAVINVRATLSGGNPVVNLTNTDDVISAYLGLNPTSQAFYFVSPLDFQFENYTTHTDARLTLGNGAADYGRIEYTVADTTLEIEAVNDGDLILTAGAIGLYGHAAVAQQVLATGAGATADDIITALQALGLVVQA